MHRTLAPLALLIAACGAAPPSESPGTQAALVFGVDATGSGHALTIRNQSGGPRTFHREFHVERQTASGGWEAVETSGLLMRESCDPPAEPPECVEVATGTTFRAAPWNDMFGDAQCACEECGPAGAGTYRFAFTACEGETQHSTGPFTIE